MTDVPVVVSSRIDDGIACVTLSRPDRLNAVTAELMAALESELGALDADPTCRVIIVTGAGRGFCAGLDLQQGFDATEIEEHGGAVGGMLAQERVARALTTPRRLATPVIAAVNGPAAGGGLALALSCDVRVAAPSATFNVAFVKIGLSGCDCGVSWLLPRAVGSSLANEMMLTGRPVDAEEALRAGLIGEVAQDAVDAAVRTARMIAGNSPFGVAMTKQVMWEALAAPSLDAAIALENRTQVLATLTADMGEAHRAFVERRSPDFQGR